ncbi:YlbF family regulator [Prosthecobacter fluviatilis]|uniref:YlbF family regulator n=1 Tax=Prosthecobacter fluviatilis TaxID=445931 RepID=A0ABW0KRX3_9BACT
MKASPQITSKIVELCEVLVADSEVQNAREKAEAFLADEAAVSLYREMATLGRSLHQKQHHGEEPSGEEISRFTDLQDQCDANTAILSFVEAQDVLRNIAEVVNGYVGKSLERGKVPTEAEVFPQGCGEGCGCHH